MRPQAMTLQEARDELEKLGSSHDPVEWRGCETTPDSIYDATCWRTHSTMARKIRVSYHGRRGWVRNGTLSGMVRDRRRGERDTLRSVTWRSL